MQSPQSTFDEWQLAFLSRLNHRFESTSAEEILEWSLGTFGAGLALGTGLGASGMVLIDLALRIDPSVDIFYIDTGYFFAETLELIQRAEEHYGRSFRRVTPAETVAEQNHSEGPALYQRDPDRCCALRKVQPMHRALQDRTAWMSALRRDQGPTRQTTPVLRWSPRYGVVKIAPLALWSEGDIWRYVREKRVPTNALHQQNYPSIGCFPCTQPVAAGATLRDGRWAGLPKSECGLHWAQGEAA